MVRFEKDKIIIEIETNSPVESWKDTVHGLVDLLQYQRTDVDLEPFNVYTLIKEMLPDDEYCRRIEKLILKEKQ